MLLQSPELIRLLIVFIPQLILASIFLYIAIKLLKRNRIRPIVTLSMFYIFSATGLIFNAIFLLIAVFIPENDLLMVSLYFLSFYPILFSPIFIFTFIITLLKLDDVFTLKKQSLMVLIYGLITFFVFFTPDGIRFTEEWRPIFSWTLLAIVFIVYSVFIVIPTIIYSRRLLKTFQDKVLKKKLLTFIIGVIGMLFSVYGATLYITWQDPLFRAIWSVATVLIIIPSALFIYYGIGREL